MNDHHMASSHPTFLSIIFTILPSTIDTYLGAFYIGSILQSSQRLALFITFFIFFQTNVDFLGFQSLADACTSL